MNPKKFRKECERLAKSQNYEELNNLVTPLILHKSGEEPFLYYRIFRTFVHDIKIVFGEDCLEKMPLIRFLEEGYNKELQGLDPKEENAKYYLTRGHIKHALELFKEAISDFDEAIRLYPDYSVVYLSRGNTRAELGQYRRAIEDYNLAIRLDANSPEVYFNRGLAKTKMGKYTEAIEDFEMAKNLNPDLPEAFLCSGYAKYSLGCYKEALQDYEAAIVLNPKSPHPYYFRGILYIKLGKYSQAKKDLNYVLELDPINPYAISALNEIENIHWTFGY